MLRSARLHVRLPQPWTICTLSLLLLLLVLLMYLSYLDDSEDGTYVLLACNKYGAIFHVLHSLWFCSCFHADNFERDLV